MRKQVDLSKQKTIPIKFYSKNWKRQPNLIYEMQQRQKLKKKAEYLITYWLLLEQAEKTETYFVNKHSVIWDMQIIEKKLIQILKKVL